MDTIVTRIGTSTLAALAAGALLALAVPASATTKTPTPAPSASPAGTATTEDAKRHEQRYCVEGITTGTILPRKTCHTRAEWLKEGVDPLHPQD